MHIPDGFLDTRVLVAMDLVSFPSIAFLSRRARTTFEHHKIPLMGVMGAFIFAAQMINFPVGNGTSGHLIGGALLSYVLGPAAAAIVLTAILIIQAFVFQDGGILALGANIFNMAIAGVLVGYLPYRLLKGKRLGIFLGGFLSVLVSAVLALAELGASKVSMPTPVLTVSILLFAAAAAIEGAITLVVMQSLARIDQRFRQQPVPLNKTASRLLVFASVFLAVVGVVFASTRPDGLQNLAVRLGIDGKEQALLSSPLANYQSALLGNAWLSHAVAGIVGLFAVYVLCAAVARLLTNLRPAFRRDEA